MRPVALEYHSETSSHDCSVAEIYNYYRPVEDFVKAMNLRWTGYGADYVDPEGVLIAFDPSAYDDCSSALLVREKSLKEFLSETGLALVWAISGQKSVAVPRASPIPWTSFSRLSGACVYAPGQLKGYLNTHPDKADHDE